jgi:signal peptidase
MHPAIPKYSLVYIENYDLEDMKKLEVGDVIAVRTSSDPMLHRIIKIDAETIQTQGDANNSPDSPIRFKQVIGKKVFSIPYLGILFISPYPWLILMALLIILLIGRQLIKEIQKK